LPRREKAFFWAVYGTGWQTLPLAFTSGPFLQQEDASHPGEFSFHLLLELSLANAQRLKKGTLLTRTVQGGLFVRLPIQERLPNKFAIASGSLYLPCHQAKCKIL
jgi:hypothetical protein